VSAYWDRRLRARPQTRDLASPGGSRGRNPIGAYIGEHRSQSFTNESLGDGTTDAVARASDEGGFARRIEKVLQ
jgi:hypothetical protein